MATTVWGSGLSADELLALAGHVELTSHEIVSAALQVVQNAAVVDANTIHLWRCNEGTGSTLADAGSAGHTFNLTGTYSWLTGANAWLGAASLQLGSNGYATTGLDTPDIQSNEIACVDMWIKRDPSAAEGTLYRDDRDRIIVHMWPGGICRGYFQDYNHYASVVIPDAEWHHVRYTKAVSGACSAYLDGVLGAEGTSAGATQVWARYLTLGRYPGGGYYWNAAVDQVRVSTLDRTDAHGRYKSGGYTVLTKSAEAADRVVSGIDWAGTFGASYGSIYRIQVNTGTDVSPSWVTVGGDNPTSPITGLDLTVPAGTTRWVRVYMEPRANATKSATPVLSALRVTHAAVAGAPRTRAPQRFGPALLPVGGII
jgi:hypothetical protein